MRKIHKTTVMDETGKPTEVIIPIDDFREIEELLGLDLTDAERRSIKSAQEARRKGQMKDFAR